ncbi:DUF2163 domain-containing protein [Litorisediminicola beolgyonensis]|uniref:DUF2163 domain-containing protein n=1 Tax=Litorisediminicola beolgyonensis TaxID=1173614 RepID=A0ABW3ZNH6_9RHOB
MSGATALHAHLGTGLTTVARCWAVARADGVVLGFTDHDLDLGFDGVTFRAETGLTALALAQSTGLSVDNTEAMGALRSDAITEADIAAGRYDNAEVTCWLVNWQEVSAREMVFRGALGEIRRAAGGFEAELRGLAERLNRPMGRVYQRPCGAVLGDLACGFDLATPGYVHEGAILSAEDGRVLEFPALPGFELDWFRRGRAEVVTGAAAGLSAAIKRDHGSERGTRLIELWEPLRAALAPGDVVALSAGCDKRFETCRFKFNNALNYQGFPDIPGEDWMLVHPTQAKTRDGGSRR